MTDIQKIKTSIPICQKCPHFRYFKPSNYLLLTHPGYNCSLDNRYIANFQTSFGKGDSLTPFSPIPQRCPFLLEHVLCTDKQETPSK